MQVYDGFEDGFYLWNNEGEVTVPNGWHPDWAHDDGLVRPEFKPETGRVFNGDIAAKMCHRFSTWQGVLYRQVKVSIGSPLDLFAHFKAFTTEPKGGLQGKIGLDPYGGADFRAETVEWSGEWGQWQDDKPETDWYQLEVATTAKASVVTVFLSAKVHFAANTSAAFWDSVVVHAEGDEPEPPTPPSGEFDWERLARGYEALAAVLRGG
jgi:hypothetical protein